MAGNSKKRRKAVIGTPIERILRRALSSQQCRAHKQAVAERAENARIDLQNNTKLADPSNAERLGATFDPITNWLDEQEATGEAEIILNGVPILRTPSHSTGREWFRLVDALRNVVETFDLISSSTNRASQTDGLAKIASKLDVGMLLFQSDIDAARSSIAWMRSVAGEFTPNEISEYTQIVEMREHVRELKIAA